MSYGYTSAPCIDTTLTVLQADYSSDNTLERFAVDFSTTYGGHPLSGRIGFHFLPDHSLLPSDSSDSGTLSASLQNAPAHGGVTLNSDGTFTYVPDPSYTGVDSFTYSIANSASGLTSAPATVTLVVSHAQVASTVVGNIYDHYTMSDGGERKISLTGWVVFDDVNGNGLLDVNEPNAISDLNGFYKLLLTTGEHHVCLRLKSGWAAFENSVLKHTVQLMPGFGPNTSFDVAMATPTVIDAVALYTSTVQLITSNNALQSYFDYANQVMANSDTNIVVNLAGSSETDYVSSASLEGDLSNLSTSGSGLFAEAAALRTAHHADLTILLTVAGQSNGNEIGLAYELQPTHPNAATGFGVVALEGGNDGQTLAHELGHMLGADHDAPNAKASGLPPYAHGSTFVGADGTYYQDVMSYGSGTVLPFYSTPDFSYDGQPLGSVAFEDNALAVRLNGPAVARYSISGNEGPASASITGTITAEVNVLRAEKGVIGGTIGVAVLTITDPATGPVVAWKSLKVVFSKDDSFDDNDLIVRTLKLPVVLHGKSSRRIAFRFLYPGALEAGEYSVIAEMQDLQSVASKTAGDSSFVLSPPSPVVYAPAFSDTSTIKMIVPPNLVRGHLTMVAVYLKNAGNSLAVGDLGFNLAAKSASDSSNVHSIASLSRRIIIAAGWMRLALIVFAIPNDLQVGDYELTLSVVPGVGLNDTHTSDKTSLDVPFHLR